VGNFLNSYFLFFFFLPCCYMCSFKDVRDNSLHGVAFICNDLTTNDKRQTTYQTTMNMCNK